MATHSLSIIASRTDTNSLISSLAKKYCPELCASSRLPQEEGAEVILEMLRQLTREELAKLFNVNQHDTTIASIAHSTPADSIDLHITEVDDIALSLTFKSSTGTVPVGVYEWASEIDPEKYGIVLINHFGGRRSSFYIDRFVEIPGKGLEYQIDDESEMNKRDCIRFCRQNNYGIQGKALQTAVSFFETSTSANSTPTVSGMPETVPGYSYYSLEEFRKKLNDLAIKLPTFVELRPVGKRRIQAIEALEEGNAVIVASNLELLEAFDSKGRSIGEFYIPWAFHTNMKTFEISCLFPCLNAHVSSIEQDADTGEKKVKLALMLDESFFKDGELSENAISNCLKVLKRSKSKRVFLSQGGLSPKDLKGKIDVKAFVTKKK